MEMGRNGEEEMGRREREKGDEDGEEKEGKEGGSISYSGRRSY